MARRRQVPTRGDTNSGMADAGLCRDHNTVRSNAEPSSGTGRPHEGLRQVLCRVEQFIMGVEEVLAAPTLADTAGLRSRAECLLSEIRNLSCDAEKT